ncbi:bifunctional UDP-N-acetylglucosamine diphosphorylase/glucosamine-1-phosphate N-acetyltransferase GlmU [Desmospora profundinema]|uniref:Bifunctional protein GlmU n=1 Tax=Desmospora profundinema TaxID=1571184 RepID=A0ABU1ITL0_9BACL|nr:bifunctional UDP-N-acetylglucosamine diphosphorylase/glucosamine-1-phosphate N-acetyltransferase GlmU [Desmospora profundinema]MDR6227110.1 bifunctional UDP-N-acetylglucosamine pyrophosphorylase/glucosamine-1-phosphate N-acetyltransferase [Desmospora profundinema]
MEKMYAVVLAAGKGTRMKSRKHKVLHPVCGKPIIDHIVDTLEKIGVAETVVVIGHDAESVQGHLGDRVKFARQEEQLGTAHAVMQAEAFLSDAEGTTLVLNGDHPLFTADTLSKLVEAHRKNRSAATILTADLPNPAGYGRVIRREDGHVVRVVEHKDATPAEREITEVNTGTFCFDNRKLWKALSQVDNNNAQGEYYLPDVIHVLGSQSEAVGAQQMEDHEEAQGINNRVQLAQAEQIMRQRILEQLMMDGVTVVDPAATYIDADVTIGADTVIEPGTILRGNTRIGEGCVIGPNTDLTDVEVGTEAVIRQSVIQKSRVDDHVAVGPFAYIRPGSHLEEQSKVGCFVDMKKARLGKGSKVSHLGYVGDADVGEDVNVGCGALTVNYDGFHKHRTIIEDGAFIGCNVNLIAPVTVGKGAYVAAGSTVTDDVPAEALAIARERQTTKREYVRKLNQKLKND